MMVHNVPQAQQLLSVKQQDQRARSNENPAERKPRQPNSGLHWQMEMWTWTDKRWFMTPIFSLGL